MRRRSPSTPASAARRYSAPAAASWCAEHPRRCMRTACVSARSCWNSIVSPRRWRRTTAPRTRRRCAPSATAPIATYASSRGSNEAPHSTPTRNAAPRPWRGAAMSYHYEFNGGILLGLLALTLLVALPIKVGAHLVAARETGLIRCGFTAFVALLGGLLAAALLGGLIGGTLAWLLGFFLSIRMMLGTTFLGAIGLTVVATLVSLAGLWLLSRFGVFVLSPETTGFSTWT